MPTQSPEVSVTAPVNAAINCAKEILFRPFDLGKWAAIGFCAWLANLGQGGGNYHKGTSGGRTSPSTAFASARTYVMDHLSWIIPVAIVVFVILIALWVLILWLQSRGSFMLLHCVALNRGEVVVPWRKFVREARSLWHFKLVLGAVALVLIVPVVGVTIWMFIMMLDHGQRFDSGTVPAFFAMGLAWMCLVLPLGVLSCFTRQFVVPIMYLRGVTCMEGWSVLLSLLGANPGRFILYLLFQIVIGFVCALVVIAAILCTCCVGLLLLIIPYVGTVALLPIIVFWRSYSLLYLAQYGAEFDVFRTQAIEPQPTGI